MRPLSEDDVRGAFVNASDHDLELMSLPGLHEVLWDEREYLGWRDALIPRRGYLVHWADDQPVGILLRAAKRPAGGIVTAMCSLCHTMQPGHQVSLFTAPRAGDAGRDGNTVGTYICDDLACSLMIRMVPAASPMLPDPRDIVARRAQRLTERLRHFTEGVLGR